MRTTLFVAGFGSRTRARDLAYEFERYGRLVRCDIPAPKSYSSKPYAFVEFEDPRDADDAFNEMHGIRIDGHTLSVQWARNAPSANWRFDRGSPPPMRRRSPSPRRYSRSYPDGGGLPPPPPRGRSRSRSPYYRGGPPPRSPSPRGRSPPPYRRYDSRSRSPPRYPDERYPPPPSATAAAASGDLPPSRSRSPRAESPLPPRRRSPSFTPPPRRSLSRSPGH
ncbi:hypothetical protein BCR43DRAFT_496577 [Syncephalastrum racemosum]|uniref:RRM domain-containing protein n=1 Tax=Syncephalastrum racemosum TaxID=13706 RepID=A0A1X2H4A7_SYNRA|nr:hypothetical protein BCR43DRAFT_496577 [Syncephalastrum racemosum]